MDSQRSSSSSKNNNSVNTEQQDLTLFVKDMLDQMVRAKSELYPFFALKPRC
jgi:hypothetical protein